MQLDFQGILEAVMTHGPLTVVVQTDVSEPLTPVLTSANAKSILKLINVLVLKDDHFDILDAQGTSVLGRRIRKTNETTESPSVPGSQHIGRSSK
jgi:hypothetical protein